MSGIDFSLDAADRSERCVGGCFINEGVTVRLQESWFVPAALVYKEGKRNPKYELQIECQASYPLILYSMQ